MNRQELIRKYYAERAKLRPYCPNRNRKEEQFKSTIYTNIIDDLNQLDEPQKPVVPQFVGDWIELCKEKADLISCLSGSYEYGVDQYKRITEDEDWLFEADHQELVAQAWLFGYEVKKEPLYYVYLPEIIASPEMFFPDIEGAYLMKRDDGIELADNNDFDDMKFTEQEIKAIDERYWAFAVPVIEGLEQEE